jgi:hypothetical protein
VVTRQLLRSWLALKPGIFFLANGAAVRVGKRARFALPAPESAVEVDARVVGDLWPRDFGDVDDVGHAVCVRVVISGNCFGVEGVSCNGGRKIEGWREWQKKGVVTD